MKPLAAGTSNVTRTPDRRFLMGALLIGAVVRALFEVPELNGRFEAEPFAASASIHCGLAVAMRGGGLIAPAMGGCVTATASLAVSYLDQARAE